MKVTRTLAVLVLLLGVAGLVIGGVFVGHNRVDIQS